MEWPVRGILAVTPLILSIGAAPALGAASTTRTSVAAGRQAASDPEELTIDLPGDVHLVMVRIPAGTFEMGSPDSERGRSSNEGPQHQVTISEDFYLGKYEVTQAQWQAVMGLARPDGCDDLGVGADYPVYCVSWRDVCGERRGFLKKLNDYLLATNQTSFGSLRLPSEAEWEYAARAGTTTRFSFGDASQCSDPCGACDAYEQSMWWCGNAYYSTSTRGARRVGLKLPNPWGLYDMHGNVWEWVADLYGSYSATPTTDPIGSSSGSERILRGGAWGFWARSCRSARRGVFLDVGNLAYRWQYAGLRLAASPPQ